MFNYWYIFISIIATLLDFDNLWTTDVNNTSIKAITTVINNHTKKLKSVVHIDIYARLLGSCAEVSVLRMILFLKNKLLFTGMCFNKHEIERIKFDFEKIQQFYLG